MKKGPAPRSYKIQRLTFEVPLELHRHIKVAVAERGTNITQEIIRLLVAEFGPPPGSAERAGNPAGAGDGRPPPTIP